MSDQARATRNVRFFATPALQRAAQAGIAAAAAIAASIVWIDRPVARFMAVHIHDRLPLMAMASPASLPAPLATLSLIGLTLAHWSGYRLGPRARLLLLVAVATLLALIIKDQLKFDFGRVWPETHPLAWIDNDPSFIGNHVFGFFPFHGGSSYAAFPSGHTTAITAPMAVLWMKLPRFRPVWGGAIVVVVAGLIGADFHFVSDTIAGFALGVAVAAGAVSLSDLHR